jgi:hypothetical protein
MERDCVVSHCFHPGGCLKEQASDYFSACSFNSLARAFKSPKQLVVALAVTRSKSNHIVVGSDQAELHQGSGLHGQKIRDEPTHGDIEDRSGDDAIFVGA